MKLLTAQAIADEGTIDVLGHDLPRDSKEARAEMGVVPQLDNLDTTLTVEQNLIVFTYLYRVPKPERQEAVERALKLARLQLAATRSGCRVRLRNASAELLELVDFMGLEHVLAE